MKIAYILPSLQKPSGWRSHAAAFLQAVAQVNDRQVEPVLFVAHADRSAAQELFGEYFAIFDLPTTQQAWIASRSGPGQLLRCFRRIRQADYPPVDLVHSLEGYPTGLVGSWLARKLGRPHVITAHGTYGVLAYERLPDHLAYRRVLRSARLVCPVSQATAEQMQRYYGKDLQGIPVRPVLNGNQFCQQVSREQAEQRLPLSIPTLLSVGEVKPRKGQHLSLAAFAQVKRELPAARYWIVGRYAPESAYYQKLKAFIAAQGLQDVSLLGALSPDELRRCYQEASLFLLTPQQVGLHFEGFGLVYLEAGAYGLPVVATRSGGVPEAVKHEQTGLLAPEGDVQAIAAAILRLLGDAQLARRMGLANRQWAETLTWERNAQEQLQLYSELVGG